MIGIKWRGAHGHSDARNDRLLTACSPERVILFGSAAPAQGRAARDGVRPGSGLDPLVVTDLPEGTSPREMARRLHALFEGWRKARPICERIEMEVATEE